MGRMRMVLARPWVIGVLVVAVCGVGFGLYWFQPWKLWQDETVEEALPGVVETSAPDSEAPALVTEPPPQWRWRGWPRSPLRNPRCRR